jgi:Gp49-like protein DUF891
VSLNPEASSYARTSAALTAVTKNENIGRYQRGPDGSLLLQRYGLLPLLEWLDELPGKVQLKCTARISRLAEMGNELRRPEADYLRDGIYELRASYQGINYRILYFFLGRLQWCFPTASQRNARFRGGR